MRIRIKVKRSQYQEALAKRRNWLAMGTLAAYSASGAAISLPAQTQSGSAKSAPSQQSLPVIRFDISAGALAEEIEAFELASGWKVEIPNEKMRALQAQAVSGMMPPAEALKQILAGSGLTYRIASPGKAVLQFAETKASVEVSERAPIMSPRYTEPLRDIPQTITVIPKEVIE